MLEKIKQKSDTTGRTKLKIVANVRSMISTVFWPLCVGVAHLFGLQLNEFSTKHAQLVFVIFNEKKNEFSLIAKFIVAATVKEFKIFSNNN